MVDLGSLFKRKSPNEIIMGLNRLERRAKTKELEGARQKERAWGQYKIAVRTNAPPKVRQQLTKTHAMAEAKYNAGVTMGLYSGALVEAYGLAKDYKEFINMAGELRKASKDLGVNTQEADRKAAQLQDTVDELQEFNERMGNVFDQIANVSQGENIENLEERLYAQAQTEIAGETVAIAETEAAIESEKAKDKR